MWIAPLIYFLVSIMLWQFADAVFIPELLANRLFEILPVPIIESGVQLLGPLAKELAFAGVALMYFGTYWVISRSWSRLQPLLGNASLGAFILWSAHVLILFPVVGSGLLGSQLPQGGLQASLYLLGTHWLFARMLEMREIRSEQVSRTGRRVFVGALALVVIGGFVRMYQTLFKPRKWSDEVTPVDQFYVVSKNAVDPVVPEAGWTLDVRGPTPHSYSLAQIRQLPSMTLFATLACISNPVGGDWMGNARWTGVPLATLLHAVGIPAGVRDVVLHASDGYSDSIPLERALEPFCLLAYAMNDAPLTSRHGFPLRLIVPGIYGMKNVKWITAIEMVSEDYKGYWQRRGWDDGAHYKLMSRIDVAQEGMVAGVAFAGDRGVKSVQVKVGDQPWREAELRPALSPISWVLWSLKTDVHGKGVLVRMFDAAGEAQIAQPMPPYPEGSSGLHLMVGS